MKMETWADVDFGGEAGVLEFSGPDAVRFLNGQITQDVRKVGGGKVLPSCVTDAKGKLQFRVWISEGKPGEILVFCRPEMTSDLEARLTRYLIADEVEVRDRSGEVSVADFGAEEMDEQERIEQGIPKWGAELTDRHVTSRGWSGYNGYFLQQGLLHRAGSHLANQKCRKSKPKTGEDRFRWWRNNRRYRPTREARSAAR